MATILLKPDTISKPVMDLIFKKQFELRKQKGVMIGLAKTIEILLKEAYLTDKQ